MHWAGDRVLAWSHNDITGPTSYTWNCSPYWDYVLSSARQHYQHDSIWFKYYTCTLTPTCPGLKNSYASIPHLTEEKAVNAVVCIRTKEKRVNILPPLPTHYISQHTSLTCSPVVGSILMPSLVSASGLGPTCYSPACHHVHWCHHKYTHTIRVITYVAKLQITVASYE